MKSLGLKLLMLSFMFLFILTTHVISPTYSGENGGTQNTLILSDEPLGNLISVLVKTEYDGYNLYQTLMQIQTDFNPSVSGIITPVSLSALASCPSDSQVFTSKPNNFPAGSSLAISTGGAVQTVNYHANDYCEKYGTSTLLSSIIAVWDAYFVHSGTQPSTADFNTPLMNWTEVGTTYNVFAIASGSVRAPPVTPTHKQKITLSF